MANLRLLDVAGSDDRGEGLGPGHGAQVAPGVIIAESAIRPTAVTRRGHRKGARRSRRGAP